MHDAAVSVRFTEGALSCFSAAPEKQRGPHGPKGTRAHLCKPFGFACARGRKRPLDPRPARSRCRAPALQETAVAIYHLSIKTVSRSSGRSATGAAAYRAGVRRSAPEVVVRECDSVVTGVM